VAPRVQRVSVAGSWWRHAPHGGDPLGLPSPPSSGRWQRGETIAAIYLADEESTAWAEWYRVLAEIALPPTHGMPRDLWRWTVAVNDIADLSTPAKLARHDLPTPRPGLKKALI
jgi:RES domain-containing protein